MQIPPICGRSGSEVRPVAAGERFGRQLAEELSVPAGQAPELADACAFGRLDFTLARA